MDDAFDTAKMDDGLAMQKTLPVVLIDNTVPVVQLYRVSIISICVIKRLFVLPTDELRGSRAVHAVKVGMLALARRFPYRVLFSPV